MKERSKLRQINKRFNKLAAFVKIENLIIFDRMPPVSSRYKFTGEPWQLQDTVYVTDLNKFLVQHAANLQNVKRLVIISVNRELHDFKVSCGQLKHLELYSITLHSTKILESPKLESIYLHQSFFGLPCKKLNVRSLKNASIPVLLFDEMAKMLKSVKYLEINDSKGPFMKMFLARTNLNIVERIKLPESQFDYIASICDRFKTIKRVDYFVPDQSAYDPFADPTFRSYLKKRKNELEIRPFGINPLKATFLSEFYGKFSPLIKFDHISITLIIVEEFLRSMAQFKEHLDDFFRMVTVLSILNLPYDEVYKRMINVDELVVTLKEKTMTNFEKILAHFPQIIGFKFYQDAELSVPDHFIDLSGLLKLRCVHKLKIAAWQKIDLSFLLGMTNLKYLVIVLYHPIDGSLFLDLLRKLKHLAYLEILFVRPNSSHSKEELSE